MTLLDCVGIGPILVLIYGALAILLSETFSPGAIRSALIAAICLFLATLFFAGALFSEIYPQIFLKGLIYLDNYSVLMSLIILGGALLVLLMGAQRLKEQGVREPALFYALYLISTAGALLMVAAAELMTLLLGFEIMSLALYALCASATGLRRSSEAGVKYFVLGSFNVAVFLYGIAIIYGLTGSTFYLAIAEAVAQIDTHLLLVGMGLVLLVLLFKVGAVPLHYWVPDVYEGAPTSVSAFMACTIKVAAISAALRFLWVAFGREVLFWSWAIATAAVLTMLLGNLVALRQRGLKRMLAYSSIAHVGYMLVAFLASGSQFGGAQALLYYLVAYSFMTLGAFGVVIAVTSPYSAHHHPDDISRIYGLAKSHPGLALLMTLFMLSLAGLPPGMAGLLGKFYIFSAAVKADYVYLALVGVVCSLISCYYYLRVVMAMYFVPAQKGEGETQVPRLEAQLVCALSLCAAAIVLFGLFPSIIYDSAAWLVANG